MIAAGISLALAVVVIALVVKLTQQSPSRAVEIADTLLRPPSWTAFVSAGALAAVIGAAVGASGGDGAGAAVLVAVVTRTAIDAVRPKRSPID
jgi:uncharacterized protein YcfJ